MQHITKKIAILGAGPSGLFLFKKIIQSGRKDLQIDVFEKGDVLGAGMPYSYEGAGEEHITNVSGNEVPELITPVLVWLKSLPEETIRRFNIKIDEIDDYRVLPRLLFGQYLSHEFNLVKIKAKEMGILNHIYFNSSVTDVIDTPKLNKVLIEINGSDIFEYDQAVICTGHNWPKKQEGLVDGYFDSPYPPKKLKLEINHAVAIRGSSLTAIDAIRTLSRCNGEFKTNKDGKIQFYLNINVPNFKMVMHSRNGMLPAVRFHLDDSHLQKNAVLSDEIIARNKSLNEGFLSLDFIFEQNFKLMIKDKDPDFYVVIKDMKMEEFVEKVTELRDQLDVFQLFKIEYLEAEQSIKSRESVYWKEMLAILSFAMNYPAKYFSAEDTLRLQKVLMPLISIVIAFVPQSSVIEMLALHQAGILDIVTVGDDSRVEAQQKGGVVYHYVDDQKKTHSYYYKTFIDCIGQPHIDYEDFPYPSLLKHKIVSRAKIKFRSQDQALLEQEKGNKKVQKELDNGYYLQVPGITINDHFQVIDEFGAYNERIYIMAVPYIGGYNPDYSGLDFSEAAADKITDKLLAD